MSTSLPRPPQAIEVKVSYAIKPILPRSPEFEAAKAEAEQNRKDHPMSTSLPRPPPAPPGTKFVAVKSAVMLGAEHIATACSKTMAKRIANALNKHKPNREGV